MKEINGIKYSNDLKSVVGVTIERKISSDKVILLEGVETINARVFRECHFGNIYIPDSVVNIEKCAFINCKNLKSITLKNVKILNEAVFKNCEKLEYIEAPNIEKIMGLALANCAIKKLVNFPKLEHIAVDAFEDCKNLEYIFIDKNVRYIDEDAFFSCPNIKKIEISKENKYYDSRNNCNAIIDKNKNAIIKACVNTIIPNDICCITGTAFGSLNLEKIVIPEGVRRLIDEPFYECRNLKEVVLPSTIESFDIYTFHEVSDLLILIYNGTREQFNEIAFSDAISEDILNNIKCIETLENAIEAGKSFKEANKMFKK